MKSFVRLLGPASAVFVVLALVAAHRDPKAGFTSFLHFGSSFAERRLPVLAGLPVATYPGAGYDGQFYAQLALSPDPRLPAVRAALDNPP